MGAAWNVGCGSGSCGDASGKEEMISLTPLHHVQIRGVGGEYLTFLFNSNFYCIYGHDSEVSCNGFLFNGSSRVMRLKLSPSQSARLDSIVDIFRGGVWNTRQLAGRNVAYYSETFHYHLYPHSP